jgi:hypothetical protein
VDWYNYLEDPDVLVDATTTEGKMDGLVAIAGDNHNNIDFKKLFNSRNRWLPLERIERGPNNREVVVYPFLQDKHNMRDQYLISQVAMIEPYKVKYGETGPAWKAICENLKALKYQSNLVFQKS